ncbi:hypothetical protein F4804DRAFT_338229 [Jackrogersella minutella]|nr:hypothetical protein F4804DRAFT_338229 [Jackrogersella minutella]
MEAPVLTIPFIRTIDDANNLRNNIRNLEYYVGDVELEQILPTAIETMLREALIWIPMALDECADARHRFTNYNITEVFLEIVERLHDTKSDIEEILEDSDELKERYGHNGGQANGGQANGGQANGGQANGGQFNGGQFNGGQFNGGHVNGGHVNGGQVNGF